MTLFKENRMTKEVLKQALDALEEAHYVIENNQLLTYLARQDAKKRRKAITAIKEALAQPTEK
jgi:Holliday junction resolvase RusA-like endonuclease